MNSNTKLMARVIAVSLVLTIGGCGGDNDDDDRAPAAAPAALPVTLNGLVQDGPVSGGSLYFFTAATVQAALDAAASAEDRAAALAGAGPIAVLNRIDADGDSYQIEIPAERANDVLFVIFDSTDATDETFGDTPFNMESHALLGAAGTTQTLNVTPHTAVATRLVLAAGQLGAAEIEGATAAALTDVISALGTDETGVVLLALDDDPYTEEDAEALEAASAFIGLWVRTRAELVGRSLDEVLAALVADASDGTVDGDAPAGADSDVLNLLNEIEDTLFDDAAILSQGGAGPCSESARFLALACAIDVNDDRFEGLAICNDVADEEAHAECLAEVDEAVEETEEECGAQFEARLGLCDALGDAAYEPPFGESFADNFVDPLEIGGAVAPNPYLPLVPGNEWVYESTFIDEDDGEAVTETTTVTVTEKVKLIEGIECIVVKDIVEEDGELIEDTDDWFAQDLDGNVWYCGEIAKDFEYFDGDEPVVPELVEIEGSWKAGRDGAQAGILVPAEPEIGAVFRNEVAFGEAEDYIEVFDLAGNESTDAASCDGVCLVVKELTPLEPDAEETTYYKPGVGVVLEVDEESGDRSELISFSQGGPSLEDAKLLIEHNATDEDTGFQGFGDGDPWNQLTITGPEDVLVLTVEALGGFLDFGVTELFFETSEPENAVVPIDDVLDRLAEGSYDFEAEMVDDDGDSLAAEFSHDVPMGPELVSPAEDAAGLDPASTVVSWNLVTTDLDGEDIDVVGYQVIVDEVAEVTFPAGFAKPVFSVYLPADATSVTVPAAFMAGDACYEWEVLAIEESGNQSLSSSAFETGAGCVATEEEDPEGLKDGKLLVEHNATDEDTGFQGFVDGDPWNLMTITDPDGVELAQFTPAGGLFDFGLTELFFETSEPENAEVPIPDVLARLPEGFYTYTAVLVDGGESTFTTTLTHDIPAGPELTSPENESVDVDPANTVVSWEPVTTDLDGEPITIVGYQVIVEEDVDVVEFPQGFAQPLFSVYLPSTATSVVIPAEFMRADTDYAYEVLAIEESGNQTLSSAEFATLEDE